MKNIKKALILVVVIFFFIFYSYKITETFIYHPDFARDLYDILKIVQGKITLIGPKLTFGGIYSGPHYYYLFVPVFWLSKLNIHAILYFNTFLFAISLGYFFTKTYEKYSFTSAILGTLSLGLLPLFLISSRNPSNAFSHLPLLLFLATYLYFNDVQNTKKLLLVGLFSGIIATFHLVTLSVIVPIFFLLFFSLKKRVTIAYFFGGFILAFTPLILFELRHNFIMLKNTFIVKSYLSWVNSSNIPGGLTGKKNVFENIIFIASQLKPFLTLSPFIYFITAAIVLFTKKRQKKETHWAIATFGAFILLAATLRFQFIHHYLFPVAFFVAFITVLILMRVRLYALLVIIIIFEVITFPKNIYTKSWRTPEPFEKAANLVIDRKLVNKNTSFNIIQISNPDLLAPIAFEYRYFFRKEGFVADSEFAYNTSKTLFIFSEIPDYDIQSLSSWEIEQFGKEYLKNKEVYKTSDRTIYKITK